MRAKPGVGCEVSGVESYLINPDESAVLEEKFLENLSEPLPLSDVLVLLGIEVCHMRLSVFEV